MGQGGRVGLGLAGSEGAAWAGVGGTPGLAQSCPPSRQAPPSGGQDPEGGAGTSSSARQPCSCWGEALRTGLGLLGHREEGRGHRQNGLERGAQQTSKLVSTLLWASVKLGRQRAGV